MSVQEAIESQIFESSEKKIDFEYSIKCFKACLNILFINVKS